MNAFDIDPNYMCVYYFNIMLDIYQNNLDRLGLAEYFLKLYQINYIYEWFWYIPQIKYDNYFDVILDIYQNNLGRLELAEYF